MIRGKLIIEYKVRLQEENQKHLNWIKIQVSYF